MSAVRVMREPDSPPVILVADEEEVVARVVTRVLRHVGYTVLTATSGEEGLALVRRRQPPIDLVLGDGARGIGGMDGAVFATAVLTECPGPRLILVGPPGLQASVPRDLQTGRVPILEKPLDLDLLLHLIRMMLPMLPPATPYRPTPARAGTRGHERTLRTSKR